MIISGRQSVAGHICKYCSNFQNSIQCIKIRVWVFVYDHMRQSCCRGLFLNWEEGERPGSFSDFKFLKILGCSNSFHGLLLSAVFLSQELYRKEQNTHERIQKIETSCRPHRKKTGCPKFWFWHLLQHMMMPITTTRLIIIEMSNLPWKISEWEGVFL